MSDLDRFLCRGQGKETAVRRAADIKAEPPKNEAPADKLNPNEVIGYVVGKSLFSMGGA